MAAMTARERSKHMTSLVEAILCDNTKEAETFLHDLVADSMRGDFVEPEEGLSKWYRDGVEELGEEPVVEFVGPPKKRWWHGIGFH